MSKKIGDTMNSMKALIYFSQLINQSTITEEKFSPVHFIVEKFTEFKPILINSIDLKSIQYSENNIYFQYLKGKLSNNSFLTLLFKKIYLVTIYLDAVSILSQDSTEYYEEYISSFSMSEFPEGFFFGFNLKNKLDIIRHPNLLRELVIDKKYLDSFNLWRSNYYSEAFLVSAYNFIINAELENVLKNYISSNYCFENFYQNIQFLDRFGNIPLVIQYAGLDLSSNESKLEYTDDFSQSYEWKDKGLGIADLYHEYLTLA